MLDVQAVVLDEHGRVLLVPRDPVLWDLPGGAVLAGESAETALKRILREEAGVALATRPRLASIDLVEDRAVPHGHAVVYRIERWLEAEYPDTKPVRHFFARDDLPAAIEPSTRARLSAILGRSL